MTKFSNKTYSFLKVLKDSEKRRFLIMRTVGNFLILFAIVGVFITFAPVIVSQVSYRYGKFRGVEYEIVGTGIVRSYNEDDSAPLSKLLIGDRPKRERIKAASTDFGIVIPKIGANAKVVADVNAADEKEYQKALMQGVAHAAGTAYPGGGTAQQETRTSVNSRFLTDTGIRRPLFLGSRSAGGPIAQKNCSDAGICQRRSGKLNKKIYLFAHSTDNWWNVNRYNAVFFLLKELEQGDEIDVFYKGRRYVYQTVETKIVEADKVGYLVEPSKREVLVLQTCWPPGTTLKRLIVIAKPVADLSQLHRI